MFENIKRACFAGLAALLMATAAATAQDTKAKKETVALQLAAPEMLEPLLQSLLPTFLAQSGIDVHLFIRAPAEAGELARQGKLDALIIDDPALEDALLKSRDTSRRFDLLYAELILAGPASDPARIAGMASVVHAFAAIARTQSPFVSRGDAGTVNRIELGIWAEIGGVPKDAGTNWYALSGADMPTTLAAAALRNAYTLADKAAWLQFQNRRQLVVVVSEDPRLQQRYTLSLVNPAKHRTASKDAAEALAAWVTGRDAQSLIGGFAIGGDYPFVPHFGLAQQ